MQLHSLAITGNTPGEIIIKTSEPDIDILHAVAIYDRVNGTGLMRTIRKDDVQLKKNIYVDDDVDPNEKPIDVDAMTIRDELPDGYAFYRAPGRTGDVMLIQTDETRPYAPSVHTVTVPAYLIDMDTDGTAVRKFFLQVAKDAFKAGLTPNEIKTVEDLTYGHLLRLDAAFLSRYGIRVKKADTRLAIQIPAGSTL